MVSMALTKRCTTCAQVKPLTEYYRARGATSYRPSCKTCTSAKRREAYRRLGGSDVPYAQLLKREYDMSLAQYNAMVRKQAGRCAVCRRAETVRSRSTGEIRRLSVDHDHVTGAIRALLCQRCNLLVWALEDNHIAIASIRAYVEKWRESFANSGTDLLA